MKTLDFPPSLRQVTNKPYRSLLQHISNVQKKELVKEQNQIRSHFPTAMFSI